MKFRLFFKKKQKKTPSIELYVFSVLAVCICFFFLQSNWKICGQIMMRFRQGHGDNGTRNRGLTFSDALDQRLDAGIFKGILSLFPGSISGRHSVGIGSWGFGEYFFS